MLVSQRASHPQEKCHQYWPAERSARYQYFVVDPMAEYNMPQYILREFKVTDARVSATAGSPAPCRVCLCPAQASEGSMQQLLEEPESKEPRRQEGLLPPTCCSSHYKFHPCRL